ncbi:MAG TPA: ADP-forming succinate--CoA ligase subunit beta, partial [Clostridiales bacterium]|nr:ADP-forming succinate--CoA ligase subunit beta [Clostridiales bacterium]
MDLMEYKAKELFGEYGIPLQKGFLAGKQEELIRGLDPMEQVPAGMRYPVVLKAQVPVGGRGKAGGIRFASDREEAQKQGEAVFGMTIKGHPVKRILVLEKANFTREMYLAVTLDRGGRCPEILFCSEGGVDIEETARTKPESILRTPVDPRIGIREYNARYLSDKAGLTGEMGKEFKGVLSRLYEVFCAYDCMLAEINPLVVTAEGHLLAADGKITVDDNALKRQEAILTYRDEQEEDPQIRKARHYGFLYIPCEPDGTVAVMSNGSGMIMSCIDLITKAGMQVGAALDLGGGATADRIAQAVELMLAETRTQALLISIFGGITRCDEVAAGIRKALAKAPERRTQLVVRIEGTRKEAGMEILSSLAGRVRTADSILEGV